MLKKSALIFVITVLFSFGGGLIYQSFQIFAATCPAATDTGVYYDPVQKRCDSAHGAVGYNVNGLQYTCGADGSIACPDGSTNGTQGNTCVYYDPVSKNCNSGTGGQGYNPASGCKWRNGYSTKVLCPGITGSPVLELPLYVHVNGATAQNPVNIEINDNGYGYTNHTTDASGNITLTSFSGDTITIAPGSNPNYTVTPGTITTFINTNWGCGRQSSSPCTFTATSTGVTPSVSPSVSPTGGPTATISLVVGLPGIGFNAVGGVAPKHLTRPVTIDLYNATVANPSGPGTTALGTGTGTITYDSGSDNNAGYFVGTIPNVSLPSTPPANNQYKILVKIPQDLYTLATNTDSTQIFTLTAGGSATTLPFTMYAGNVAIVGGGLNHLGLDDYNILLSCYGSNATSSNCPVKPANTTDLNPADLNDDGVVDIVDLNIFLRSLYQLQQLQPSPCVGITCTGF